MASDDILFRLASVFLRQAEDMSQARRNTVSGTYLESAIIKKGITVSIQENNENGVSNNLLNQQTTRRTNQKIK